ncbi:hypothetical protein [Bacillus sp. UNC438CL73TsuS30]|uniref:hypothetical protein n=1 Tax=Bacillus sp. UNC438CL73TsuS30 TaxID=1340434 RepID=UPI0012DC5B77|nr:hypothetical protein [Bacillus sp. UNC438CL73TsuS30]
MSESSAHSDSFDVAKNNRVRIKSSFGQLRCSQEQSCLNQVLIRTAWMYPRIIVSESRVHSDSFDVAKGNRVRIKCSFGQL